MTAVDARGKSCPMPIVLLAKAAKNTPPGETIVIQADDRAFPADIEAWCSKTKNELVSLSEQAGHYEATIRRT